MRGVLLLLATLLMLPFSAIAQERANTILVLDGSGSMWGQIDSVNKIVIARDVVAEILADFPEDQNLGLTVYGHRTRGDCSDIETVVTPGIDNRQTILDAVNAINPRGKTPMTDSVIAAAEALRYTEEVATVILVSDGIETCNPDPCAAARVLEEAGIGFTAHVVGFDVTEADALAQMQCIADETGGQFLTASNADELSQALTQIATAPEPEPEPVLVDNVFTARQDITQAVLTDPILWSLTAEDGTVLVQDREINPLEMQLADGAYRLTAYRALTDETQETTIQTSGTVPVIVNFSFADPEPQASLAAPDSVPGGSVFEVTWEGTDGSDVVQIGLPDGPADDTAFTQHGNPLSLIAPWDPGIYEVRYRLRGTEIIATRPITVTPGTVSLDAPETVGIGESFDVAWTGPDVQGDVILLGLPGENAIGRVYASTGTPVSFTAPGTAGDYELRYQFRSRQDILIVPITITDVQATVSGPETAIAGDTVQVAWTGPDNDRDYISIAEVGADSYVHYTYTREGSPAALLMPTEPGDYELRYQLREGNAVIATQPITVTPVEASLVVPDTATVGEIVQIAWDGPDYERDYISVAEVGVGSYINYTYTRDGTPLGLLMPTEPGTYEVRYQLQQGGVVLARAQIEITAATASLTAPDTATAGEPLTVGWDGPDYDRDYISIAEVGADRYVNYTYTREGNPLQLLMPTQPGEYELRYQMQQGATVLATRAITVTDVAATVSAPATAIVGETIPVTWTGPDYDRDYISIAEVGADRYISYAYTRDGSPAQLLMPTEPGDYEIRYQLQQGAKVIATTPITLTAVQASVTAPETASVGETVAVTWTGPDYDRDYISIAEVGADRYINYAYTRDGSPAQLLMPTEPGNYEIRYQLQQGAEVIATTPITLTALKVELTAPATANMGDTILIGWDGPDYDRDFVAISRAEDAGYETYTYTRDGNPAPLLMPSEPGEYEVRYMLGQDRVILQRVPITILPVTAQIVAPASASVEEESILVGWDGPGYDRDYIGISVPGETDYETYAYVREGNPVSIRLPDRPGSYELRYFMHQDRVVLHSMPFEVTE